MALFESYERRIDKINKVLSGYGISSLEEALKGTPWQESDIRDLLLRAHWESFFPDFSVEMFISGLFSVKEDV